MGLSLHYRGQLPDIGQVETLTKQLIEISTQMNWEWMPLDEDWSKPATAKVTVTDRGAEIDGHLPLKGVGITVDPKSESLSFYFDPQGNLRDPLSLIMILEGHIAPEDAWVSVKTQFSSPETHIMIVGLLKYLKKHYIPELEVFDEGEYWETGDPEILKEKMNFIADKMDAFSKELSRVSIGHLSEYSAQDIVFVIEGLLNKIAISE
jgi:hypothetical protein